MDLGEFAAALDRTAAIMESEAATRCARAGGGAFLGEFKKNTPVLTGALRDSEDMKVSGGGTHAAAEISTHRPEYAEFRETGGTIHVKSARVLSDGKSFFGKSVTQKGSGYLARTVAWAEGGGILGPMETTVDRIFRDGGL
jgi:hypothetical protein